MISSKKVGRDTKIRNEKQKAATVSAEFVFHPWLSALKIKKPSFLGPGLLVGAYCMSFWVCVLYVNVTFEGSTLEVELRGHDRPFGHTNERNGKQPHFFCRADIC